MEPMLFKQDEEKIRQKGRKKEIRMKELGLKKRSDSMLLFKTKRRKKREKKQERGQKREIK